MTKKSSSVIARLPVVPELIQRRIYLFRGEKVMLDADLAELYNVPTKALNLAVRRNADRFPADFMFQLAPEEFENLRFQNETSSWGGRRYAPFAFTEHGVAMLSSVLKSKRAVQMNIVIVRAFMKLRQMLATHKDLARKMELLESKQRDQAALLSIVIKDIENLEKSVAHGFRSLQSPRRRKPRIGFYVEAAKPSRR
jgi:phage regulator Rha-like protein